MTLSPPCSQVYAASDVSLKMVRCECGGIGGLHCCSIMAGTACFNIDTALRCGSAVTVAELSALTGLLGGLAEEEGRKEKEGRKEGVCVCK